MAAEARPGPANSAVHGRGAAGRPGAGGACPETLGTDSFLRPAFTLEQLRTFLTVASREHITRAAKVLRLSQPAVTQQVQMLERGLGVRLLERVGRNVRLTSAGVEVAGACLLVMRALENLERTVHAIQGLDVGRLVVGATHLSASEVLPRSLSPFALAHPCLDLEIVLGDAEVLCHQVASGDLDCAILEGPLTAAARELITLQVARAHLVLVGHATLAEGGADPDLLAGARAVTWSSTIAQSLVEDLALTHEADQGRPLHVLTPEAARSCLLHAPGLVAVLPSDLVADDVRDGRLVVLAKRTEEAPVFAVRRPGPQDPALEALWRDLVGHLSEGAAASRDTQG